jgi:threonine/homoserine/homoserine lactone efflux protein
VVGQALGPRRPRGARSGGRHLERQRDVLRALGHGLGAILLASSQLFTAIKWLGAIYLIVIGVRMVIRPEPLIDEAPVEQSFSSAHQRKSTARSASSFWRGFVTQAANPKALVFFTALLPQFIQPSAGVPKQILILGVSSIVLEFGVLGLYVAASTGARKWTKAPGLSAALQRSAGALLVVAGARLVVTERAGVP